MADDTLWWEEEHEVEDTEKCDSCQCYFAESELLGEEEERLCLDCLNARLEAATLSVGEILALEDQRDGK